MTPPAIEAQGIGEVTYVDPEKTSVPLKTVWVVLLFFFGVGSSAVGFIVTQTTGITKLEARMTITETSVTEIKEVVKGIDAKLEVQTELRARMNAADERMNRIERQMDRTGRASATAAHLQPNES